MKQVILTLALTLLAQLSGAQAIANSGDAMGNQRTLIDFSDADQSQWRIVNDGVMGGLSQSEIRRTDQETGVFAGVISLENNGGFVSVRALVGRHDLTAFSGLELRIRGDGRMYQLRLRTNDRFDGVAYKAEFETKEGEWITVRLPFTRFAPTFRGRTLSDALPLDTASIRQVSFLLADKRPGPFLLEIDSVKAWRAETAEP